MKYVLVTWHKYGNECGPVWVADTPEELIEIGVEWLFSVTDHDPGIMEEF